MSDTGVANRSGHIQSTLGAYREVVCVNDCYEHNTNSWLVKGKIICGELNILNLIGLTERVDLCKQEFVSSML